MAGLTPTAGGTVTGGGGATGRRRRHREADSAAAAVTSTAPRTVSTHAGTPPTVNSSLRYVKVRYGVSVAAARRS
ncbi:hypothetical protein [Streptomyces sp. NPDC001999]